jgi:hypothetical protein
MKGRGLLAAILLGVGLCFVPALGHTELNQELMEIPVPMMFFFLSQARVDYMMGNPDNFLDIQFYYDPGGIFDNFFPEGIDTKDKILVHIEDNRGVFSDGSETTLLKLFKRALQSIYSFLEPWKVVTDMDTDIVAEFFSKQGIALGYFYQGEYHVWGE